MGCGGAAQDLRSVTPARGRRNMEVELHLFANLADYGPPGAAGRGARVRLPAGATVGDLLRRFQIPEEVPQLLLVNGQDAEATTRLGPGDVVDVLPALAGG